MIEELAKKCKQKLRKVLDAPNCSICLEPLYKDLAAFNACGHVFHHQCAINASLQSRKCPMCRHRSMDISKIHYQIEEIDGVEQQMQDVLTSMSAEEQFKVADLLSKYEDAITQLGKLKQRIQTAEERLTNTEARNKTLEAEHTSMSERLKKSQERKMALKMENQILDNANNNFKIQSEQQYQENKLLKTRIQELNYLAKLQQVIEGQTEDAHIKQIKLSCPAHRQVPHSTQYDQAQEFHDLYLIKSSQLNKVQQEMENYQDQVKGLEKKLQKQQRLWEDLNKENQTLKNHITRKQQDRSQENSTNQITNFFEKKQARIDQEISIIGSMPVDLKKRNIVSQPQFGQNTLISESNKFGNKNSLLQRIGISNPITQIRPQ